MSFPAMNAQSVTGIFMRATADTVSGIMEDLQTGPINMFQPPAVIDVSGMEFAFALLADSDSGTPTLVANEASAASFSLSDGGATGDNTTVALLASVVSGTAAWADTVPRGTTGTSTTDIDADDWVNFHVSTNGATVPGASIVQAFANYIYGKPGAIN